MRALLLIAAALGNETSGALADDFIAGADCSHLRFFEDRGVLYKMDDRVGDALDILHQNGVSCIRLRLFTSNAAQAQTDPYNRINNLEYTVPLAVRAKRAGMKFMLDFHYSDTWADPGHQAKPTAWNDLGTSELEDRMYQYSRDALAAFQAAGASPDFVQVGNEITGGLLWPDGRVGGAYENPRQWAELGRLLKAAIRGIHEGAGTHRPKILIHIDRGGDWSGTQWYFDHLRQEQVEFDIIGQSYYPFWHGTLDALRTCLSNTVSRYAKPVAVLETAFPWANSTNVLGIPATPDGQVRYLAELTRILKSLPNDAGAGIVWWGTEYRQLDGVRTAGFEFRSLFAGSGNVLPAAKTLGQSASLVFLNATLTGSDLALKWHDASEQLSLVTATNLSPPVFWTSLTNRIEDDGLIRDTALPVGLEPARFFRLQSE